MKVARLNPATTQDTSVKGSGGRAHADSSLIQLSERADAAPQTHALAELQARADQSAPVQRVKTETVDAGVFRGNMRAAVQKEFEGKGPIDPQALLDASRSKYQANRTRGQKLIDDLEALKSDPDAVEANRAKAASNDQIHAERYNTSIHKSQMVDGKYGAGTDGLGLKKKAYTNDVYPGQKAIVTNENYAKWDRNRPQGIFLSNSEVFWQQWKAAVDADTPTGPDKDSRRNRTTKSLGQITRFSISNYDTLLTVHYALPNGEYFQADTTLSFGPDQEEFAALLGTPNGRGVGYLLKDHYHEMDKHSFGGVTGDGSVTALTFTFA